MLCRYCDVYCTCPDRLRRLELVGKKKLSFRYCNYIKQSIGSDNEACENFKPHRFFHCDTNNYRQEVLVCLKRPLGCPTNCSQRRVLVDMGRGRDLEVDFGLKEPSHNRLRG